MNIDTLPKEMLEKYSVENVIQDEDNFYFYKHISIDAENRVLGIFNNNEIKYNYADNFNDPYDCLFKFKLNTEGLSKNEFENMLGEKVTDTDWTFKKHAILGAAQGEILKAENKAVADLRKTTPITCFNSNPLNILMWSHYAQHHYGIMIEFRIPKNEKCDLFPLPVEYSDEYPIIHKSMSEIDTILASESISTDLVQQTFLRKSKVWSYEKEYRVIGNISNNPINNLLIKFDPTLISSVILGTRFKETGKLKLLQNTIRSFNKKNKMKVRIHDTKLIDDKYKIMVLEEHPRLARKYLKEFL